MDRLERLDSLISRFDLNTHPFYNDWRAGSLPTSKLSHYGVEYGQFIGTIAEGWETVGRADYAAEERDHEQMWKRFQSELPANEAAAQGQTAVLVNASKTLFGTYPEALGALYSFEAQQPNTSSTKLEGLREHYKLSSTGEEYFVVHAGDVAEAAAIREMILKLSDGEFERAYGACQTVCAAMWSALDGVYYTD